MSDEEARLKTESAEYQKLQLDLSKVIENSQQLSAQLTETQSVRDVSNVEIEFSN